MKYIFKCLNEDCPNFGKRLEPSKYSMKYDAKRKRMVVNISPIPKCVVCGREMVVVEVNTSVPDFSVGTFAGLSDEKKKEILQNRANSDMKKVGNEEVNERKRKGIAKLIGYDE